MTALPAGIDPDSADSLAQWLRTSAQPSTNGRFVFAFIDEDRRCASVRLHHGLAGHRRPPTMHRCAIGGGGVHLIELHTPAVHRIEYRFGLIDDEGREMLIADPRNPLRVRDPFAERSVAVSDAYRAPPEVDPPPPEARGTLREISIDGPAPSPAGNAWQTTIWRPPGFDRAAPLPVLLFLDGSDYLRSACAREILEHLVAQRAIQPCAAVFMKPAERNAAYAVNPATAAALADSIPRALAQHMPWPQQSQHRIAVGASLGALCLLHAHITRPQSFGGLILQSGSFFQPHTDAMERGFPHFDRMCEFVARVHAGLSNDVPRIPLHVTCGAGEENLLNNRALAQALRAQGFPLTFHEQPDAHNWTCWRDSLGDGLKRMLP